MIHYSTREVLAQYDDLWRACDALPLSTWERDFLADISESGKLSEPKNLTEKQKTKISEIWGKHFK